MRKTNKAGVDLIKSFEGLELKAYKDIVGVLTIGYGSTGPHVKEGQTITEQEAEALLLKDMERFESGVESLATAALTDNQFAALVSLSFNVGLGNLKSSTLLKLLNAGDYAGAANQFPRWNKAGGKEVAGLTRRRLAEQALFNSADATAAPVLPSSTATLSVSHLPDGPTDQEIADKLKKVE